MIGIDLFAGAGGMSLGARMAGIEIKIAVDNDKYSLDTYSANHPETIALLKDINEVGRFEKYQGSDNLCMFGGPPCQGFSTSNQRTRSKSNPSNWLFQEFLRVVEMNSPGWVVFENVKGILETEKGVFVNYICNRLRQLGYAVTESVLNSVDFGVPQKRSRMFIIGNRLGIEMKMPKPIISSKVIVEDAISDLPDLPNGAAFENLEYKADPRSDYARKMRGDLSWSGNHFVTRNAQYIIERYKHIPQGGNWECIPQRLMGNYKDRTRCHTGIYYRLRNDQPSVVIGNFRKNMLIHPTQDRGLSVREAARLQSFPDWYVFKGSIGFQQQQVGNAVPPMLAKAVFSKILISGCYS